MTIAVGNAIAGHPSADIDTIMADVAGNFIEWAHSPENNRAPGATCMEGVRNLERGEPWRTAGVPSRAGCGAAMRALIGYLYANDPDRLYEVAEASAIATHRHPLAVSSAVAAAYMIKLGLEGVSPLDMIEPTISFIPDCPAELSRLLRLVRDVVDFQDEELAKDILGQGWLGHEAVALSLYCAARYPDSWVDTVRCGAPELNDPCISGGIQAARLGITAIPTPWIERLERREELFALADKINLAKTVRKVTSTF